MTTPLARNPLLGDELLPAEIVLHPSWWHRHAGITFDEDFFYDPRRRVEAERHMEAVLYDRFGQYGLGGDRDRDLPVVGPVHNAAGYLISEMLGCRVDYTEAAPPQVIALNREDLGLDLEGAFASEAFKRFERLCAGLKARHGYLTGDVNWSGVLNLALDLRGHAIFLDMMERPEAARAYLARIAEVIERFVTGIARETGSSSISVNRTVRHLKEPVFLHSECSNTMISEAHYAEFLMPVDAAWSRRYRPFGIHYCGGDAERHAEAWARLPALDFVDVGWGSDVAALRAKLPGTFLNLRLSPVDIVAQDARTIRETIVKLVEASGNPYLTGVCCINMDDQVGDDQIAAIFETVADLRRGYAAGERA